MKQQRSSFQAAEGEVEAVGHLLDFGVDKDFAPLGERQFTALIQACRFGHVEVLNLLLQAGASINLAACKGWPIAGYPIRCSIGFTALCQACKSGV